MKIITVREYAYLSTQQSLKKSDAPLESAIISQQDFDYLCSTFTQNSDNPIFRLAGKGTIQITQYVGVIETPSGTVIEILPKHVDSIIDDETIIKKERLLLQKMLKVSLNITPKTAGEASLTHFNVPINEWIITQFLQELDKIIKKGLRFEYNALETQEKYLKGRLNHSQHMRQSPCQKHLFPINYDEFNPNRAENRLMVTALGRILKITRSPNNWRLANELRLITNEIPTSQHINKDFEKWQTSRLMSYYEAIKPWCRIILFELSPFATKGSWQGISMLFPMEVLFEKYVLHHVKKIIKTHIPKEQVRSKKLCVHIDKPMFSLRPDIFLKAKTENVKDLIIDTKWKLIDSSQKTEKYGIKDSDMQQMFAYSYFYLNCQSDVLLIYPKNKNFQSPLEKFQYSVGHTMANVWVLPFDIDNDCILFHQNQRSLYVDCNINLDSP